MQWQQTELTFFLKMQNVIMEAFDGGAENTGLWEYSYIIDLWIHASWLLISLIPNNLLKYSPVLRYYRIKFYNSLLFCLVFHF